MARSRSSPSHRRAHRPSTAPAPAAAAPSTAAEEDVFDEEEEPQGEMAGMSVGDFVEEVKMAEAKLLDEQAAEREAAYRAKQLEEWYGRVGHLIRSLDETPPELQDAHAPPPDMLELPRDGPGARVLRLARGLDQASDIYTALLLQASGTAGPRHSLQKEEFGTGWGLDEAFFEGMFEEGRWLGRWSGTAERGETAGAPMRRGGVYFAQ